MAINDNLEVQIVVRMRANELQKLKVLAAQQERSMAAQVRFAITLMLLDYQPETPVEAVPDDQDPF